MGSPWQTGRYAAQLNRARLSSDDFAEASEYLSKVGDVLDDIVKRALLTAAIVSYVRPFTNNKGATEHATSQLSVSLSRLFTSEELQLHGKLISLRNEVVAHTTYARKPVRRLEGTMAGFTMSGRLFDLLSDSIDLKLFRAMCDALKAHCFSTMMELNKKIVGTKSDP